MVQIVNFMPYGDSKTASGTWPFYLCALANNQQPQYLLREYPTRIGVGGREVSTGFAAIDAELAAAVGTPAFILFNLGANDADESLVEVTWKMQLAYILDAMHTKWPDTVIYLMRAWRQNYDNACDTLATWIGDVIASRSWCRLGPDERVFLKGNDNGATNTSDGTHPNAAGNALTGQQWLDVLYP